MTEHLGGESGDLKNAKAPDRVSHTGEQLPSPDSGSGASGQSSRDPRREFVRKVGRALFTLIVVDVADPSRAQGDVVCNGTVDSGCDPAGDCTISYFDSYDKDENCTKGSDRDNSCSKTEKDESCTITQLPKTSKEQDEYCSATIADPDESCGDCDDNHDADEHCGVKLNGTYDPDDLCGHASGCGPAGIKDGSDPDDVCGQSVGGGQIEADGGCGTHKTVYNPNWVDPDESCGTLKVGGVGVNPDMNCNNTPGETFDQYCNTTGNNSTTSPDEHCGTMGGGVLVDADQACSHYDADEGCGKTKTAANGGGIEPDEACGWIKEVVPPLQNWEDPDESCPVGGNDPANPAGDSDNSDEENKKWPPTKSTPPVMG